ncbi:MAG: MATE family efflux transporter [Gemmatimonadetes bacterium]|nr:MATE family efflux transporter [Gemmatimonadota bacterium]
MNSTAIEVAAAGRTPWLQVLRDAIAGRGVHPTEGALVPAIITLAVPMVLEMVMESLFAVTNVFFVSRLGASAAAAVGVTESLLALIYTVAMGLSIGVTALVARRIGEGNPDAAARTAVQALLLGGGVALVLGVVLGGNARALLRLMGADAEVVRVGGSYATIMLTGNGVILLLFLMNAAFRGAADAAIAMRVLWLANGINIVLDPCLIYGVGPLPELGVTGSAVATTIGRGTGVVVQLLTLARGVGRLEVSRRHLRVQLELMARVLRLSGTGTLQVFIGTASWIGLIRVLAGFGSEALAGYVIAIRIVLFALLPAWGLANAAATMVGQSLGARMPERAERAVWIAGFMNFAVLGLIGIGFMLAAPRIVSLFGGDAATATYAAHCLRIVSAGFFFYAYGMVLGNSFNGAGDTWTPTYLNLFCFWFWEIPLAWLLARELGFGPEGVYAAILIAFSTYAVAAAVLFRRGRWKSVRV